MKIKKEELRKMIKESINKKLKVNSLEKRKDEIINEISSLYENELPVDGVGVEVGATPGADVATQEPEEKESIFDSKPGETVILNFQGVTLKIQRQLDDLFKVVDAAESKKLKEGDYVKIQGNDSLEAGRSYKFSIYRQAPQPYETNELNSWKIISN